MIPSAVQEWLKQQGHGEVVDQQAVSGGCINNGLRLTTSKGNRFFLKSNSHAPKDMFAREVEGLAALHAAARAADGPRLPRPYLHDVDFLLLEDLAPAPRRRDYWLTFGRQLARLHNHVGDQFGFEHDNYIGSTPQPNSWTDDGYDFFAQHRLIFQAEMAAQAGLLSSVEAAQVAQIAQRLPELIPAQPASLIHGDLWGGNAITDEHGQPALIDPAAHYGWAEADLAMTSLFGGFTDDFYAAYLETRPLETGWRERFPLYNLYHLLNHLNLFGRGYYGQAIQIIQQYI